MKNTKIERIHRVCDYIHQHLDDELSLNILSDVACYSKFHFHRLFIAHVGVSVVKFAQFARFKRAAYRLAFETEKRVTDIALEAGFETSEAFYRAFKRTFNISPSQFRNEPNWPYFNAQFNFQVPNLKVKNMKVEIVEFSPQTVAMLTHIGPVNNLLNTAAQFIAWRKETKRSPVKTSKTFGIAYNDPAVTEEGKFKFGFAGSIDKPIAENKYGVVNGKIPGGRCAVIRHFGSHDKIGDTVYYLYTQWLAQSNEEVREFPCFFHYLNLIHEVDECDLITDIYLPIK